MQYDPQLKVAEMMKLFGQEVHSIPNMITDPKERLLAANLVVEEALEFAAALGFTPVISYKDDAAVEANAGDITLLETGIPDLVEAADAIGDILVVTYGAANRLGVNAYDVFKEVNRSNMSKVWADGTVHKREFDGKVIKPETYSPADLVATLKASALNTVTQLLGSQYPEIKSATSQGRELWAFVSTEAFGKEFGFSIGMAERAEEIGPVGSYQKVLLARKAAMTIVFFFESYLNEKTLADALDVDLPTAFKLLTVFKERFPKVTPRRPLPETVVVLEAVPEVVSEPEEEVTA